MTANPGQSDARPRIPAAAHRRLILEQVGVDVGNVVVDGMSIRYARSAGVGEPLILCNGIGANLELMLPLVRALKSVPVLVFDLPGIGGSPRAHLWPSYARYARLVLDLLGELDITGSFAVGGVSWGGGLALHLARARPQRVRALVLMATTHGRYMVPGRLSALRRMITPQRYLSRQYMVAHAAAIYGGAMAEQPDLAIEYARLARAPTSLAYLQQLVAASQFNSLHWLHRIRCPALVVAGDDDPIVRPINARVLAALLPKGHLHLIPRGGHLFMSTHAEETATLIRKFIHAQS